MIEQPTVLILGAGASAPHGFPLGPRLIRGICDLIADGGELREVITPLPALDALHAGLSESHPASIDEFLEANPELYEVGKQCIAAALGIFGPLLGTINESQDWYRYIWGRLREGAATSKAFRANRLSIVTYNYESSLHRYLTRVLRAHYPDLNTWPLDQVRQFAEQTVPIIHLHGSLGPRSDEIALAPDCRAFLKGPIVREMASRLKIIHDAQQEAEYSTARERIGLARYVYMLGFGYHPTNVSRLNLTAICNRQPPPWINWGGTAYDMGKAEVARAEKQLHIGANVLQPIDSLGFLRGFAHFS